MHAPEACACCPPVTALSASSPPVVPCTSKLSSGLVLLQSTASTSLRNLHPRPSYGSVGPDSADSAELGEQGDLGLPGFLMCTRLQLVRFNPLMLCQIVLDQMRRQKVPQPLVIRDAPLGEPAEPPLVHTHDCMLASGHDEAASTQHCRARPGGRCRQSAVEARPDMGQGKGFSRRPKCSLQASAGSAFSRYSGSVAHSERVEALCNQEELVHGLGAGKASPRVLGGLGNSTSEWLQKGCLQGQLFDVHGLPVGRPDAGPHQGSI